MYLIHADRSADYGDGSIHQAVGPLIAEAIIPSHSSALPRKDFRLQVAAAEEESLIGYVPILGLMKTRSLLIRQYRARYMHIALCICGPAQRDVSNSINQSRHVVITA
ncbi:hypothetical protein KCU61_g670, partial [Aureobasidium melanogenum]